MSVTKIALDLYCKAGVSGRGLAQAGYTVIGIDIEPQPNYPYEFIQGDALRILKELVQTGWTTIGYAIGETRYSRTLYLSEIDFIWASPPCQKFSRMQAANKGRVKRKKKHKDLLTPTLRVLRKLDKQNGGAIPWCVENVEGAPMKDAFVLCGSRFGLGVSVGGVWYQLQRHRQFVTNFDVALEHRWKHKHKPGPVIGIYGGHVRVRAAQYGGRQATENGVFGKTDKKLIALLAMGLPRDTKITMEELSNGVPPAYSQFIASHVNRWVKP
mgnify:CR=1 FL=1